MKYAIILALVSSAAADDPRPPSKEGGPCDPERIDQGCVQGYRCQLQPAQGMHTCIAESKCGSVMSGSTQTITCSDTGKTCDSTKTASGCIKDYRCAEFPALYKNRCVPKSTCDKEKNGITPVCSNIGAPCKSKEGIKAGCSVGFQCIITPLSKKDMCVASADCDQVVNDVKTVCTAPTGGAKCDALADGSGCPDGMSCVTSPQELAFKCVAREACDKMVGEVKTVCGATTLAATFVTAFAIASTM
jgi:hypothetical protein